ncbi:hypothetical protein DSCO28_13830 [Desulfosarcina ovata subsp. sediminis]|uniref:Uncharacterized protein n=1 Tax=Desulfosarcina ovata subsp. sediminis TaxID=885957 RepID=A0A5K7ZLD1_9BACT|nr:hypothetical protein [Desulfosarcina ovata]BBO80817.1 hypothetical protein DSCO28_13830 [Desulfosarcina ovata subsp. sediminis]
MSTRYCYHDRKYIAWGARHGIFCDPVRRPDGKCIVSKDKILVRFLGEEAPVLVMRRTIRLRSKCKNKDHRLPD